MSKVAIQGNASGTGTFTIAAPNSNTDRTLTLPDEAGTVLTGASDIESQVKTATNATGSAPIYSCRAWVNFNGTGTVAIRDDGNVSSITDVGTGDYVVNFTTSMPDANYSTVTAGGELFDNGGSSIRLPTLDNQGTSGVRVNTRNANNTVVDPEIVCVAVFR